MPWYQPFQWDQHDDSDTHKQQDAVLTFFDCRLKVGAHDAYEAQATDNNTDFSVVPPTVHP